MSTQNINYLYFVWFMKQCPNYRNLRVLDYGCGKGEIVELLKKEGIDCYGADVYIEGTSYRELFESELFQNGTVKCIHEDGSIPFEDGYFDVILSNQVMEHVPDKDRALRQMDRVLKNNGIMYHHFPSREVIREGHIGIPFAHWFRKGKMRLCYTIVLRSLGVGYFTHPRNPISWATSRLEWLDRHCFYEKYQDMHRALVQQYFITHREIDYCLFRAERMKYLHRLLKIQRLKGLYQSVFRRLGFMAIELRRRNV